MDYLACVKKRIEEIVRRSGVPEDPGHSVNTLEWLLRLDPAADEALRIAALGHDIERAWESRRIQKRDYPDFDSFKAAHAANSAEIIKEIMDECGAPPALSADVHRLVGLHETGGSRRADLLKEADSLSFFQHNLPFYYLRHDRRTVLRRCRWGYERLSPRGRSLLARFAYADPSVVALVKEVLQG